ncbi:MAG TPA: adenosylmethionine--8-amino-7-oxononanoate transaminase [Vicinamibacterales bacterium]|jgi:adenosylmethionine-8-amino-7-oxononanoate aminotransferase
MNDSDRLASRDRAHVWHPYTQMQTAPEVLAVTHGEGVYLYTDDGRRILDGISSWWVNIHGHSHPKLNEALATQARRLEHVIFAGFTHAPAVELAERLVSAIGPPLTHVFYSDDGSTAVEASLKMAYQYWQLVGQPHRRHFLAIRHGYHGDTVGAMSVSEASPFTAPFGPLLFDAGRAHSPYCARCPLGLSRPACQIACLADLDRLLTEYRGRVAAVIVEPMLQAAGGMIVWPREFLSGVRTLCTTHQTLLIADEVMTGFGRTGRMFACEHGPIQPDIMCLSKALTAGYLPLGATVCTDAIFDAFLGDRRKTFFHGHSFTANPLACAVAVASLDLFRTEAVLERVTALEALFRTRLQPLRHLPGVADVRVIGGVGILELDVSEGDPGYLANVGPALARQFLSRNLLLRPLGNVLYFMPPYVITDEEANWALDQISDVVGALSDLPAQSEVR